MDIKVEGAPLRPARLQVENMPIGRAFTSEFGAACYIRLSEDCFLESNGKVWSKKDFWGYVGWMLAPEGVKFIITA
jgi:hypothetical protein